MELKGDSLHNRPKEEEHYTRRHSRSRKRSHDRKRSRSYDRYTPHSKSEGKEKYKGKFPFLILVSKEFVHLYNQAFCKQVCEDTGCELIGFEENIQVPDIDGKVIKVQDKSLKTRKRAAKILVEEMMAEMQK